MWPTTMPIDVDPGAAGACDRPGDVPEPHPAPARCVAPRRAGGRQDRLAFGGMADSGTLTGRRALITGGASGIGRACAVRLADRESTRLNSSHANISDAVFFLEK